MTQCAVWPVLFSLGFRHRSATAVLVPSGSLLRYCTESSRCGHPSGSSLSQSSIGALALPPPSWCLVGVFTMRSPWWVELSRILFGTTTLRAPSLGVGAEPSRWGHLYRVVWRLCALDRNKGFFFCPSILSCFAMGSPYGSSVVFLPLDRNEVFFGYLVCIPSGWGHPFQVWI